MRLHSHLLERQPERAPGQLGVGLWPRTVGRLQPANRANMQKSTSEEYKDSIRQGLRIRNHLVRL